MPPGWHVDGRDALSEGLRRRLLPERGGLGLGRVLESGRDSGEKVEAGARLHGVDARQARGVVVAGVGLVLEEVGAARGRGRGPGGVQRTLEDASVEVARDGDTVQRGDRAFVQHPHDYVELLRRAGRRVGRKGLLQRGPERAVESVLLLEGLVGVVEGLLVGCGRGLPVVGGAQVPAAVGVVAGTLLPVAVQRGIRGPAPDAADAFVRVGRGHLEGVPQGRLAGLVHQDGVVDPDSGSTFGQKKALNPVQP